MYKWYVEYSIGDDSEVLGNLLTSIPSERINVWSLQEILKEIAQKEGVPPIEVFIDNIARINTN